MKSENLSNLPEVAQFPPNFPDSTSLFLKYQKVLIITAVMIMTVIIKFMTMTSQLEKRGKVQDILKKEKQALF